MREACRAPQYSGGAGEAEREADHLSQTSSSHEAMLEEKEERISEGWDKTVHSHLMALAASPVETLWPKDSLFRSAQLAMSLSLTQCGLSLCVRLGIWKLWSNFRKILRSMKSFRN